MESKNPTQTIILKIRVVPGSRTTEFGETVDGVVRILIKAQPQDNEANDALIKFLSKEYKTPQANISIVSGIKSKIKTVKIEGAKRIP